MYSIIWDLDGTLFNTFELHMSAIKQTGKAVLNREFTLLEILRNQGSSVSLSIYNLFGQKYYDEAIRQYVSIFTLLLNDNKLIDSIEIVSYVKELSETFGNENYIFTGRDEETTNAILRYFNIEHLFKAVICVENWMQDKNSEFYIQNIFKKLNNSVYITDDTREVKYFRDNNITTYQVGWFRKEQKYNTKNKVYDNVLDIYIILKGEKGSV